MLHSEEVKAKKEIAETARRLRKLLKIRRDKARLYDQVPESISLPDRE